MDNTERRNLIMKELKRSEKPISASRLATDFSVSRQIIVGDIALLRASGMEIEATPRGYRLQKDKKQQTCRIAVRHDAAQTAEELYAIVDHGCTVLDVIVSHPIYGELRGSLELSTRYDVNCFLERIQASDALPLSFLTEGIHLHTIAYPDEQARNRVLTTLQELNILLTDN
ncbi:MAG: transcription repressor NadR [Eubacteriales bacterium]|nr:transcription repressor NadR [Eubacteriales bacterium]